MGSPGSNRILEAGWRVADPGECLVLVASLMGVALFAERRLEAGVSAERIVAIVRALSAPA